ncbi:MAG: VIT domain-containing protein [Sandaracinaceae bacterium]
MTALPLIPTQGTLHTPDGTALLLSATEVHARLDGPVAEVRVTQRFVNDQDHPVDALYSFPLPARATVHSLEMRIGARVIHANVKRKAEARAVYERARAAGRAATLLEADETDVFTLSLANLPRGEAVVVVFRYEEQLAFDDGEWRFVFPMVEKERYLEAPDVVLVGGSARGGQTGDGARLPFLVRPPRVAAGTRDRVAVTLEVAGDVSAWRSPSHTLRSSGPRSFELDAGAGIENRDFVFTCRASRPGVRPDFRFARDEGEAGTVLMTLVPSSDLTAAEASGKGNMKALRCGNCGAGIADEKAIQTLPGLGLVVRCAFCDMLLAPSTEGPRTRAVRARDVTVLVDRSASMRGAGAQLRASVRAVLEGLPATDAVRVCLFDHERTSFSKAGYVGLSPEVIDDIDAFVKAHTPRGGTELERVLQDASKSPIRPGRTPVVVLLTDGAVGNEGRVLRRAKELLGARRLFVLGCGASPDRRLCARLARACGGTSESLADGDSSPATLSRFARKVRDAGPVLTGLSAHFEGVEVAQIHPASLPDLFGHEPLQLIARYPEGGEGTMVLTGLTSDGSPFRQRVRVTLPERAESPGLTRLWARHEVECLLERAQDAPRAEAKLREEATEMALAHRLVTSLTSLVADDAPRSEEDTMPPAAMPPTAMPTPPPQRSPGLRASRAASPGAHAMDDELAAPVPCAPALRSPPLGAPAPGSAPSPVPLGGAAGKRRGRAIPRPRKAGLPGSTVVRKMKDLADRFFAEGDTLDEGSLMESPAGRGRAVPSVRCEVHYPEEELVWLKDRDVGALDLVFLVDETGSMGPYINQVATRLLSLIATLENLPLCKSLRLGLITYRDHPPQDHTYASRATELTGDLGTIEAAVRAMVASGGGDGPESVTDGLADAVRMAWRPNAARVVVWFGDAPPHGVEPSGDGFPEGCPCGDHWYTQAESLREMGIAVYAVGCQPGLSHYVGAEAVFKQVAETTRGVYLPLQEADRLVPMMAGAAASALDRQRVDEHVASAVATYADLLRDTDPDEKVRWLQRILDEADVRPKTMNAKRCSPRGAVLQSRPLTEADVEGALDRLRLRGRAA